jgi:hypothetical protein
MEQSLFLEEVKKYFPGIAQRVVVRLNDTTNPNAITYRHRTMLRKTFSTNLKWESISVAGNIVAADVIAMDSSIPLKKRDALSRASGDIPKLAMELALREKELSDLDILATMPGQTQEFLARLFQDTPRVIQGQYETLEYMFLLGLSTGVTVIADANNVGTGIRIDYGYLTENKFGVGVLWANTATAKPLTDLKKLTDKARTDGNTIQTFMMDEATFNRFAATDEVKQRWAASNNFFGAAVPTPSLTQVNTAMRDAFGWQIEIVERSVTFEKNGVKTKLKPWGAGQVIGLVTNQVGTLTWGRLAEMNHPVNGVTYETVDDFILVSKFRMNRPSLAEFTNSQAIVIPVINNVDQIYSLDTLTVQA